MRAWSFWVALVACDGCGDHGVPTITGATSGARLHVTWVDYADGSRMWLTDEFRDTYLGMTCGPLAWSDGITRCSPLDTGTTMFTSPDCTGEVGVTYSGTHNPTNTRTWYVRQAGGTSFKLFTAGAPTTKPATTYRPTADGGCVEAFPPGDTFVTLEERSLDELARIDFQRATDATRISLLDAVSDDGLDVPIALHDQLLATRCDAIATSDHTAVCVPAGAVDMIDQPTFSDVACSEPVVVGAPPPYASMVDATTECRAYHPVRAQAEVGAWYQRIQGECVMRGEAERHHLEPPVEPATFELSVEASHRRLEAMRTMGGVVPGTLFDDELGAPCRFRNGTCTPIARARIAELSPEVGCRSSGVTLVPRGTCEVRSPFAADERSSPFRIGQSTSAYVQVAGVCVPFVGEPGVEARVVDLTPLPTNALVPGVASTD